MTYTIIVINKTAHESQVQIHNLNKDSLDTFIEEFNDLGHLLNIELVNTDLNVEQCHILGAFLKKFRLQHLILKDSKLGVEESVALCSHICTPDILIEYCQSSAQLYYQKSQQFYDMAHPFYGLYFQHAKKFEQVGDSISAYINRSNNNRPPICSSESNNNGDGDSPTNSRRLV